MSNFPRNEAIGKSINDHERVHEHDEATPAARLPELTPVILDTSQIAGNR